MSAPSAPTVEFELNLTQVTPVFVEVAACIVRFLAPAVAGSSPSIVTLSAPDSSIMPLFAVGRAAEL
ncbi:MAG: hypothetical protein ACK5AY_03005, partial [Bacteroidota bacterium]